MNKIAGYNRNLSIRPNQRKAIEALASGHTIAEAAVIAQVTERTVYLWKTEPAFKAELQSMTDGMISSSSVYLSSCLLDAFKTMHEICLSADKLSTRLAAAKAIADSMLKIREQYVLTERIADIEARLAELDVQTGSDES